RVLHDHQPARAERRVASRDLRRRPRVRQPPAAVAVRPRAAVRAALRVVAPAPARDRHQQEEAKPSTDQSHAIPPCSPSYRSPPCHRARPRTPLSPLAPPSCASAHAAPALSGGGWLVGGDGGGLVAEGLALAAG